MLSVVDCLVPAAIRIPLLARDSILALVYALSFSSSLFYATTYSLPMLPMSLFPDTSRSSLLSFSLKFVSFPGPRLSFCLRPSWSFSKPSRALSSPAFYLCSVFILIFRSRVIIFNSLYFYMHLVVWLYLSRENEFFSTNCFISSLFLSTSFWCFHAALLSAFLAFICIRNPFCSTAFSLLLFQCGETFLFYKILLPGYSLFFYKYVHTRHLFLRLFPFTTRSI